jgi:tetratricopeptide (TPR) repeat protein
VAAAPAVAPVAAAQAPAGPSADEVERLKNEVTAAYLKYRTQDPFDLLGLEESASSQKIREAFLAWSEKFAPWRYSHAELASLAEKARDLFTFGARAFAQLADSEQKTLVLKRREAARDARNRRKTTDFSIKTKLLDAKEQHDEGMRRLAAGDARGAISYLEFATDCEPRKAIFRAHLAYARFMADPNGAARQAVAEMGEALRIEPECVDAWFLSGEIYRWGNDLDRAEDAYRKASKLAPGDRRPVEALKTVVLARKKQQA